jgi:hypothetical protein
LLLQSALKASLGRFTGPRLLDRLARRIVGQGVNWLAPKNHDEQLLLASFEQQSQQKQGASILRNRFDTLAHRELILTALGRVMAGKPGQAPEWAKQALVDWQVFEQEEIQ